MLETNNQPNSPQESQLGPKKNWYSKSISNKYLIIPLVVILLFVGFVIIRATFFNPCMGGIAPSPYRNTVTGEIKNYGDWGNPAPEGWVLVNSTQNQNTTANLKTYSNAQYGFEFKYPTSFEVSENSRVFSLNKLDSNAKVIEEGPIGVSIGPIQIAVASTTPLRNRVKEYFGFYSNSNDLSEGPGISCSQKQISNTIKIDALDCRGENGGAIVALIKSDTYDIWFHASEMQDREQVFQVLSTFKFIQQENTTSFDQKDYVDANYGVEFKYPSNLSLGPNPAAAPKEFGVDHWIGEPSIKWHYGVGVQFNNKNQNLIGILNERQNDLKSSGGGTQFQSKDFTVKDLSVGALNAKLLLINYTGHVGREVYVVNNNYIYTFSSANSQQDFDQFLSTIKFIKPLKKPVQYDTNTANWKTYSNTQYEFEVKYPESWLINNLGTDYVLFYPPIYSAQNPTNPVKIRVYNNSTNYSINDWFKNHFPAGQKLTTISNNRVETKISEAPLSNPPLVLFNNTYIGLGDYVYGIGTTDSSPYWNVYTTMFSTFKTNSNGN